jgi:hypothetical protein
MVENCYEHEKQILEEDIDHHLQTIHAYSRSKEEISSACRIHYSKLETLNPALKEKYFIADIALSNDQAVAFVERLTVSKNNRGKYLLIGHLVHGARKLCRDLNTFFCFATCAPSLLVHYMKLGYRPYSSSILQFDDRIEIPIAVLPDLKFLKAMRSPLYYLMSKYCDKATLDKYYNYAPEILDSYLTHNVSIDNLDKSEYLNHKKSFFYNLRKETANFLIKNSFFLSIKKGSLLFDEKEHHQTQFIVLSGTLEVSKRKVGLLKLHSGDIIGEFGSYHDNYARCVSITALTDCRVLVLSRSISKKLFQFDKTLYSNYMQSYLKSIALREKKLMYKIITLHH